MKTRRSFLTAMLAAGAAFPGRWLAAQEPSRPADPPPESSRLSLRSLLTLELPDAPNVPTQTLGGMQFWSDRLLFHQWRIQRNVLTGHCRLLDGEGVRHAWGSFDACRRQLDDIRRQRELPPMSGRVVIALHGLIRTRNSTGSLCQYLAERLDAPVLTFGYASTRAGVADHADSFASVIEHLEGVERIDLVAHSLGNIVIRHWAGDRIRAALALPKDEIPTADATAVASRIVGARLGRCVMIAPPNQGSRRAELWADQWAFQATMGQAGAELARDWPDLKKRLACPPCEFGIIAGCRGDGAGWKDYLAGDDDGTVSVAGTRLAGAADFATVCARHTFIMDEPLVQEYAGNFLEHGYFVSAQARQPILADGENEPLLR